MRFFIRVVALLTIAFILLGPLLFFAGCRSAKPVVSAPVGSLSGELVKVDEPVDKPEKISSINKVLSIFKSNDNQPFAFPEKKIGTIYERSIPRKCKGCTFNVVAGDQQNNAAGKNAAAGTGATAGGKADGPVAGAGATATDNTKAGQRGGAAATAPNATATATTIKPPTPWLKYALWAGAAGLAYWLLFGGGGVLLLALWRRNKSTSNQA